MPTAPPRLCERCGKVHQGACTYHKPKPKGATERGYSSKWERARANYLREHPLCAECQWFGAVVTAEVVDHKRPHKGDMDWFWRSEWWQPLCKKCHDRKSGRESVSGNKYVVCGPPGAGKTTWVRARAKPGDLVFDSDYILQAMFGGETHQSVQHGAAIVNRLRASVIDWLLQYPNRTAYMIQADEVKARETAEVLQARLVVLDESHQSREEL